MPLQVTIGGIEFNPDDCETLTVEMRDGTSHQIGQPHISRYFENREAARLNGEELRRQSAAIHDLGIEFLRGN